MPYITTQAIVLHTADYRDNDRMLSLLTPEHGQLDALCRGCKKPQSPLMSAAQAFSYGEYVLYQAKGRMTVTSFQLIDSFYALREDYERLRYAACMLEVLRLQALPGGLLPVGGGDTIQDSLDSDGGSGPRKAVRGQDQAGVLIVRPSASVCILIGVFNRDH